MRRRRRIFVQSPGAPPWMVTYADMMSLLLGVFVLIAAFSSVNERKLNQAITSLQSAFGVLRGVSSLPGGEPVPPEATLEAAARNLQRKLQVLGRDEEAKVEYDRQGGIRIVLPERFFFDAGSADVKPESQPVLHGVAELLSAVSESIVQVRGHTDSRPLVSAASYRDNYDLSYARADGIARRLQSYGQIPLERFEIVACGASQPLATNNTEDGQRANRRVEVLVRARVMNSRMRELEEKTGSTPAPGDSMPAAVQ